MRTSRGMVGRTARRSPISSASSTSCRGAGARSPGIALRGSRPALLRSMNTAAWWRSLARRWSRDGRCERWRRGCGATSRSPRPPARPTPRDESGAQGVIADARRVEDALRKHFGTDVRVTTRRRGRGFLTVSYYSNDDLARLLELILAGRSRDETRPRAVTVMVQRDGATRSQTFRVSGLDAARRGAPFGGAAVVRLASSRRAPRPLVRAAAQSARPRRRGRPAPGPTTPRYASSPQPSTAPSPGTPRSAR